MLRDRYLRLFNRPLARRGLRLISLPAAQDGARQQPFESVRMVNRAVGYVKNEGIEGDYLEFGVYEGSTFVEAWHAARERRLDQMRFVAFDSFQGLPMDGGPFRTGQYEASRERFERTIDAHGLPRHRLQVVEGFFAETLRDRSALPKQAAIAWIDCDLYESTVPVLDYLTDALVDGAVVCFDDWFTHRADPNQGEQRACGEWLADNPQLTLVPYRTFHWAGQAFILHRDRT